MKEKIKEAIKKRYSDVGLGDAIIESLADQVSKDVKDESEIENAVTSIGGVLKVFQSTLDNNRSEQKKFLAEKERLEKEVKTLKDEAEEREKEKAAAEAAAAAAAVAEVKIDHEPKPEPKPKEEIKKEEEPKQTEKKEKEPIQSEKEVETPKPTVHKEQVIEQPEWAKDLAKKFLEQSKIFAEQAKQLKTLQSQIEQDKAQKIAAKRTAEITEITNQLPESLRVGYKRLGDLSNLTEDEYSSLKDEISTEIGKALTDLSVKGASFKPPQGGDIALSQGEPLEKSMIEDIATKLVQNIN